MKYFITLLLFFPFYLFAQISLDDKVAMAQAKIEIEKGNYQQALYHINSLSSEAKNTSTYFNYAYLVNMGLGYCNSAEGYSNKIADKLTDPSVFIQLSRCYENKKEFDEAIRVLSEGYSVFLTNDLVDMIASLKIRKNDYNLSKIRAEEREKARKEEIIRKEKEDAEKRRKEEIRNSYKGAINQDYGPYTLLGLNYLHYDKGLSFRSSAVNLDWGFLVPLDQKTLFLELNIQFQAGLQTNKDFVSVNSGIPKESFNKWGSGGSSLGAQLCIPLALVNSYNNNFAWMIAPSVAITWTDFPANLEINEKVTHGDGETPFLLNYGISSRFYFGDFFIKYEYAVPLTSSKYEIEFYTSKGGYDTSKFALNHSNKFMALGIGLLFW